MQKRVSLLMRSGEFFDLSREIQHRLIRRLKLLYERVQRLAGKQKLRWAGTAMALVLSAFVAHAQFADPVLMSGFKVETFAAPNFADFDGDGDLDIMVGGYDGGVFYVQNNDGTYSYIESISVVDIPYDAAPALVDLDDDADLDLVVGNSYGTFAYYENDAGDFTELTGVDNPFYGLDAYAFSAPAFYDFDDDGDYDLVSGTVYSYIYAYENDGGTFTELTGTDNPFDAITPGIFPTPGFADCDGDGDMDLYVGNKYGQIAYAENDGGTFIQRTGTDNPFDGITADNDEVRIVPQVLDVDDDDDPDLVIGDDTTMVLRYFENTAGTFVEKRGTPNPFEGLLSNLGGAPVFSDMDSDGDLDLLICEKYGIQRYYEKMGEGYIPRFDDLSYDTIVGGAFFKPTFGDLDDDADEDLLIGDINGVMRYFEKQGPDDFIEMTGGDNPFDGVIDTNYAAPVLVDLDEDGDLDCVVGRNDYNGYGLVSYHENNGGVFTELTGADNPFEGIHAIDSIYSPLTPAFADFDRDGDLDLFIGCKYFGNILYYENDGGAFTQMTGSDNPLDGIAIGFNPSLAFNDADEDGDLDLFLGTMNIASSDGQIYYFENLTTPPGSVPNITQEDGIKIYSSEKTIYLDAGDQLIDRVEIYNLAGALVTSKTIGTTGVYELNMPDAYSGMYLVRAFSNGIPTTNKILLH